MVVARSFRQGGMGSSLMGIEFVLKKQNKKPCVIPLRKKPKFCVTTIKIKPLKFFFLDDLNTGMFTNAESCCGSVIEREIINCSSPEVPAEFSEQLHTKKDKQELTNQDKGANLEKENSWYNDQWNEFTRTEKTKPVKKCPKRPDWNINKPLKRYIPASEKYPKQLQKQREEKKVRRQMELLNLVERNSPGHLSQNRGPSPVLPSSQETEPRFRWHLIKKVKLLCLKIYFEVCIDVSRLKTRFPTCMF